MLCSPNIKRVIWSPYPQDYTSSRLHYWCKVWMAHAFMLFMPDSADPTIQMLQQTMETHWKRQHSSILLLSSVVDNRRWEILCEFLPRWDPVWSSAAAGHPFQDFVCCVFRDQLNCHKLPWCIQSPLNHISSRLCWQVWTWAVRLDHVYVPECMELLPCDWLIWYLH